MQEDKIAGDIGPEPSQQDHHAGAAHLRAVPSLDRTDFYFNRELSWLEFNRRVLAEALDPSVPLLERVKFLSIFSSNLDEFFMIRVAGLRRQLTGGVLTAPPDGMTPAEQLAAIRERILPMISSSGRCWNEEVRPALSEAGINILPYGELKRKQRKLMRRHFRREIFPALTPLAFDPGHPFPHISNLSVNLAVVIDDAERGARFARIKVPHAFQRLIRVPSEDKADRYERLGLEELNSTNFVWLEEVVAANLDRLFPGLEVSSCYPFRVTRDADFEIEEDEASDLLTTMEEVLGRRHFGLPVRLEVDEEMPESIREMLRKNLGLAPYQVYAVQGPIGRSDLLELTALERPDLKDATFIPATSPALTGEESVFSLLRRKNVLLHHPYDSFSPVIDFVLAAATDPDVLTIKQTLYRVGPDSPIVSVLKSARENGKQVVALVELKARFDETNNIVWARDLERAGVHVVYGVVGLKTHAKMCLAVRREADGLQRYVHLSSGNYNPVTARVYTDFGFLTADRKIAADVTDLFNALTGYTHRGSYRKLLVAPTAMREEIIRRIEREIECHRREERGRLVFKLNALVDPAVIRALYAASQAGVSIDLIVRGICCLRPGVPGLSDNIRVRSLVGRFLEHARAYYFRNGGDEELFLGSADMMPRNLDGRVELLFPIEDPEMRATIVEDVLSMQLADNQLAWELRTDGSYVPIAPEPGSVVIDTHDWLLTHWNERHRTDD